MSLCSLCNQQHKMADPGIIGLIIFSMMTLAAANVPKYILNNGNEMPAIALGTYLGHDENGMMKSINKQLRDVVMQAVDVGYRHFDTAQIYGTEDELGEGVRGKMEEGVVRREELFITNKLWNTQHQRQQVVPSLKESLCKMGLTYIDLFLMHWPMGLNENYTHSDVDYLETWRGLEEAVRLGLAKNIGLSNFNQQQIQRVLTEGTIKPVVLQIEIHPQLIQSELIEFAQRHQLVVMAFSPFGSLVSRYGHTFPGPTINDPVLTAIARTHHKTTPQVVLRWLVDRKVVPITKTVKYSRLKENIDIFDFQLNDEEIESINKFDEKVRYTFPSFWQTHPYYPFEKVDNPIADPFIQH